jgi:hypothetical protein
MLLPSLSILLGHLQARLEAIVPALHWLHTLPIPQKKPGFDFSNARLLVLVPTFFTPGKDG